MCNGAKEYGSDRSRKMLKNEYLLAKFGVDTEENEPSKVACLPPSPLSIKDLWIWIGANFETGTRSSVESGIVRHLWERTCLVKLKMKIQSFRNIHEMSQEDSQQFC